MTATNHALTGALIGLVVREPLVALPVAYLSHYVLDALPHYAPAMPIAKLFKSRFFVAMLASDAVLCGLLVAVLAILQPDHWLLAAFCAFIATVPDLFWINQFVKIRQKNRWQPGLHSMFAAKIQWFERPIGACVEFVWFVGCSVLLGTFLMLAK
jgi:hypothetical protein